MEVRQGGGRLGQADMGGGQGGRIPPLRSALAVHMLDLFASLKLHLITPEQLKHMSLERKEKQRQ